MEKFLINEPVSGPIKIAFIDEGMLGLFLKNSRTLKYTTYDASSIQNQIRSLPNLTFKNIGADSQLYKTLLDAAFVDKKKFLTVTFQYKDPSKASFSEGLPIKNTHKVIGFEDDKSFYVIDSIPVVPQAGGSKPPTKYRKTTMKVATAKGQRVVYQGPRGGRYIMVNGKYTPVPKSK
jgi:hypothetical protein